MQAKKKDNSVPILVVEDDRSLRAIFEWIVKDVHPDLRLDWCSSAEQAELKLEKRDYRLVISDFMLAGTRDGLDLWERHRHDNSGFVLMSSLRLENFCRSAELPRLLRKPLDVIEVQQLIRESLKEAA